MTVISRKTCMAVLTIVKGMESELGTDDRKSEGQPAPTINNQHSTTDI